MVTSPTELHGAALVGCCYHIHVEVNSDDEYFSHIQNVDIVGSRPMARQHRPLKSAVGDFNENHFTWNRKDPSKGLKIRLRAKTVWEKDLKHANDVAARKIREAAPQSGGRVPDKREAQAMARLCEIAERVVVYARQYKEFGVHQQSHFKVVCTRSQVVCKAQLFVEGLERDLATGTGADHFQAMQELEQKVVSRPNERKKTFGRR